MPIAIHEWLVAPLAFALALGHASRALGRRRALLELVVLTAYGFALEWAAMARFHAYVYGPAWSVAPLGVPVAVALVWAAVITAAMALAVRVGARGPLNLALTASAFAVTLDLFIEPVASRVGLWHWTPPGPWLGVPIGNFVGWSVIVGGYTWGADRWAGDGASLPGIVRRILVSAGGILGLICVGFAWGATHAESIFAGGRGWLAWAAFLLLAAGLSFRGLPPPAADSSLPTRMGRGGAGAPAAIFALVGGSFAVDAVLVGGRDLALVAVGTLLTLSVAGWRARRRREGSTSSFASDPLPSDLST